MYKKDTDYLVAADKQRTLASKARNLEECQDSLEKINLILKEVYSLYVEISSMEQKAQGYVSRWTAEDLFEGEVRFFNRSDHVYFKGMWYPIARERR